MQVYCSYVAVLGVPAPGAAIFMRYYRSLNTFNTINSDESNGLLCSEIYIPGQNSQELHRFLFPFQIESRIIPVQVGI